MPRQTKNDKDNLTKYRQWYKEGKDGSRDWRRESAEDCRFYHGGKGQWDQKDLDALNDQSRPALSINQIKPTIDLQKGIEIRSRTDIDARPRKADDGNLADAITAGFKYILDQNNADHVISDIFFDAIAAGIGWVEICENDDPSQEEIELRYADWRNIGFDPYARGILLDDARYMYLDKWVDLEIAQETWPEHKDELLTAVRQQETFERKHGDQYSYKSGGYDNAERVNWIDTARRRVLLVQMYFKKIEQAYFVKLKNGEVLEFPKEVDEKKIEKLVASPEVVKVIKKPVDRIWKNIFTGNVILEKETPSPYQHHFYPYIPIICYVNKDETDSLSRFYGLVRNMKDPQREINSNRSQYSHVIRTIRTLYETGSIKNINEYKKEASRPDAMLEFNMGALSSKRVIRERDIQIAREHFAIMQEAKEEIRQIAGTPKEQMGEQTNARSGIAIQERKAQGSTINTEPFDNLRLFKRRLGEILLSMMRQYWTYEKVIRITDDKTGTDKFFTFNQRGQDGSVQNDITQGRFDIVVSDHPETETTRNWASARLMDFATRMPPDIGIPVLQTAFEMADIPNKEEVVKKLQEAEQKQRELTDKKLALEALKSEKIGTAPPGGEMPGQPPAPELPTA